VKEMSRPRLVDGGKSVRFISCFVGWVGEEEEEAIYSGLASLLLTAKRRFRGWEYLPAWEVMVMDGCPVVARKVFETASFGELVVASACPSRRTAHRYLYLAYPAGEPHFRDRTVHITERDATVLCKRTTSHHNIEQFSINGATNLINQLAIQHEHKPNKYNTITRLF
jgi:hypothetical protein